MRELNRISIVCFLAFLTSPTLARSRFTLGGVPLDLALIGSDEPSNAEPPSYGGQDHQRQYQDRFDYPNEEQQDQYQYPPDQPQYYDVTVGEMYGQQADRDAYY